MTGPSRWQRTGTGASARSTPPVDLPGPQSGDPGPVDRERGLCPAPPCRPRAEAVVGGVPVERKDLLRDATLRRAAISALSGEARGSFRGLNEARGGLHGRACPPMSEGAGTSATRPAHHRTAPSRARRLPGGPEGLFFFRVNGDSARPGHFSGMAACRYRRGIRRPQTLVAPRGADGYPGPPQRPVGAMFRGSPETARGPDTELNW